MPLFYSQTIDDNTRLAVWKIEEDQAFFLEKVPVSRTITHPHKRLQHLAGRFLLQYLFPDFPLALIQIATTRKPYLPEESHHFSISHCGNYAAAIVSTSQRVGIDIEEPTGRILHVMPKFLTTAERQLIVPHDTGLLVEAATILWSAKESMFKWYSHGEIDFQEHLAIEEIDFHEPKAGVVNGSFRKFQPIALQLPFRLWEEVVLSWVAL